MPYPRNELVGAERLGDVVVRAEAEALDLVDVLFLCGNHDDGNVLYLANLFAYLKAVKSGKHNVKDEKIVVVLKGILKSFLSLRVSVYLKSVEFEIVLLKFGNGSVILNYQYSCSHVI